MPGIMGKERGKRLIHTYTAAEALREGRLVEVSPELRREAGYRVPVRLTTGVIELLTSEKEEWKREGRLWDTLYLARVAIANAERSAVTARFEVTVGDRAASLWACLDYSSGPAIHIVTPQEALRD
jgi:hypothetical protein